MATRLAYTHSFQVSQAQAAAKLQTDRLQDFTDLVSWAATATSRNICKHKLKHGLYFASVSPPHFVAQHHWSVCLQLSWTAEPAGQLEAVLQQPLANPGRTTVDT